VPLAQLATGLFGLSDPIAGESVERPLALAPKEALSLMNSNAVSLGHGSLQLQAARKLLRGFDQAFAMSLEGFLGNPAILDAPVLRAHPQPGQKIATEHVRDILRGSELLAGARQPRHLQDPLSFRCAPQIHGAGYQTLAWVWQSWEIELNAVVDNPVVDLDGGRLISHGNMDTSLLAISMDALRCALANAVSASAQRLHKQHWPAFSGLPSGLTEEPSALGGVQFLNLSHIAEAYAAACRAKAGPTLFTYQGQLADGVEDHATMLPLAVATTEELIELAWVVQSIELTVAAWAIIRRGIAVDSLGHGLRDVYRAIEPLLPVGREGNQVFDMRPIVDMVREQVLVDFIDDESPPVPEFEPAPETSVVGQQGE
jgi:histidine ammonia-lyase